MGMHDIVADLRPVLDGLELVDDYISPEEQARVRELAKEIRAIFDAAVERLKCGRVG
jgi:hypothetical protein